MRAMNLLPVEERGGARSVGGPSRLTAVHGIAGVGAVVTVALLGTWAVAKKDTADARSAEASAVARSASAQAQVDRLAPVVAFDARRQARETAVLQLAAGRTDWAGVLRATAGSLPATVKISTLKLQAGTDPTGLSTTATVAVPQGLAGAGSVTLSVCADTQPRVATTLRRFRALPQVEDVALSQSSRTGEGGSGGGACGGVSADAALGLSAETIIDGAKPAAAADTGAGAAAPGTTTSTPGATTSSATTTTGTGR